MKKVEAIIRVSRLEAVKSALTAQRVEGMTITEVHGKGKAMGEPITYRGVTRNVDAIPRVKVETIVANDEAERTIDTVFQAAHTGDVGDGRIMVIDLESVTRIRTGETDDRDQRFLAYEAAAHFAQARQW